MLYIDSRVGSNELFPLLQALGVPAKLDTLESADFAFSGSGPEGPVSVGIERKVYRDLLQSRNEGRLGGSQIPLMCSTYHDRYLIIEMNFHIDKAGLLLFYNYSKRAWDPVTSIRGGREYFVTYAEIFKYVLTLHRACGMTPLWTSSREHTAHLLTAMYWHYQADWGDHKSHKVLSQAHTVDNESRFSFRPNTSPSVVRMIASQLPHVGYKKSAEVEKAFNTVADMCNATIKDWQKIPGIGKTIAKKIYESLNEPGQKL